VVDSTRDRGGHTLLLHDCNGTHGTSGAPLLVRGADGSWQVAGLQELAMMNMGLGFAVPASTLAGLLAPQAR
jgi:protease YdgD